jgi:cytochrome c oxidase subunit 2
MLSILRRGAAAGLVALAMTLVTGNAMAAWDALNLPVGVTPISRDVYDLHMLVLWICVVIGIIVFGAMFVSIVLHRKAAGHKAAQFHHSTFAEIVWTVIPSVILLGLAIPATKTLIDMEDTSEAALTLKVTAYQWLWKYEYVEDGVSFYSSLAPSSRAAIYGDPWQVDNYLLEVDNPVVLPVGKKVRILLTADDVIHAWWVPALSVKKDAIPGFVNEMWVIIEEPGTYRGQCAELCGKDHGFMPIVVEAKSDDEYKQWVAAYKTEQQTQLAATTIPSQ